MDIPLKRVKDFIQDFYAAFKNGMLYEVQQFYEREWKEVTKAHFTSEPWPTAQEISSWVKDDRAFLVVYRVLFYNHALTTLRNTRSRVASFATFAEAWHAYRDFLDFAQDHVHATVLCLPSGWVYDIFSELVYHYQVYNEEVLKHYGIIKGDEIVEDEEGAAIAPETTSTEEKPDLGGLTEADLAKAWPTGELLAHLHRLVDKTDIVSFLSTGKQPSTLRDMAAYYGLVTLVRFYTKLGDYAAALDAAKPLNVFASEGTLFSRLPRAQSTLQYYVAFALTMSQRYDDALRILNKTLTWCQRQYSVFGGSEQGVPNTVRRTSEKMLALTALCSALVPGIYLDEQVRRPLREKYSAVIEKVSTGVEGDEVDTLFNTAAPGYFSWSPLPSSAEAKASYVDPRTIQSTHFNALLDDVIQRTNGVHALRSFMKLYTSIDMSKLARHTSAKEDDVRSTLTSMKLKSFSTPQEAGASSVDPLHFFLVGNTVVIEETKQAFNINGFFIRGIETMVRLSRDSEVSRRGYDRHRHGGGDRGEATAAGAGARKHGGR